MNLSEILHCDNNAKALSEFELYSKNLFIKNMNFFSAINEKLAKALSNPPIQYNLYIDTKQSKFINMLNIVDLTNQNFVYPQQDTAHTMLDFHLSLSSNPLQNKLYKIYTNNLVLHKMDEQKLPFTASVCNEMIDSMLQNFQGQNGFCLPDRFLPNLTIFGLLGGVFLQLLAEQNYYFHSLLLFEEDIDLFRISLYFVDYENLFKCVNKQSCYVFVKDLIHPSFVQNYFVQKKITNNFLRLELQLYDSKKLDSTREFVAQAYSANSRGWGSYDDEMIGVKNTLQNIFCKKNTESCVESNLDSNLKSTTKSSIESNALPYPILHNPRKVNVPICVVGNGASLDSLLPFIKQNIDNMIIFSCGTALKPLKNAGIYPDFQIEIERISYLKDVLVKAPLENTTLLCGNMVQPNAINLAKQAYIFMRGGSASAYFGMAKNVVEFGAPFVGNAGFALALLLSSEIILCGLDCGYIKGFGKHASGSFYGKEEAIIPKNAFKVQGNAEYEVYSDALFSLSTSMMTKAIGVHKPKLVANIGNGAYIRDTTPCKAKDFILKKVDKIQAIRQICSFFSTETKDIFSDSVSDFYVTEITKFKNDLLNMLRVDIRDKKALFDLIDKIHIFNLAQSAKVPFVGILFEGSISHILHTMMICALHIPKNDISLFYRQSLESITIALNKMVVSYKVYVQSNVFINHNL